MGKFNEKLTYLVLFLYPSINSVHLRMYYRTCQKQMRLRATNIKPTISLVLTLTGILQKTIDVLKQKMNVTIIIVNFSCSGVVLKIFATTYSGQCQLFN